MVSGAEEQEPGFVRDAEAEQVIAGCRVGGSSWPALATLLLLFWLLLLIGSTVGSELLLESSVSRFGHMLDPEPSAVAGSEGDGSEEEPGELGPPCGLERGSLL